MGSASSTRDRAFLAVDFDRIRKPARKLRRFLSKPPRTPSADKIHDLRTSARRFETAVRNLDEISAKKQRKLLKDLSVVRRSAGRIREMDVLISKVATLELDDEQDCLIYLLELLEKKRKKHLRKLRSLVARRGDSLRRELKREVSRVGSVLAPAATQRPPQEAHTKSLKLTAQVLRLLRDLKTPAHLNRRNLHSYRVKVRELAYLFQLVSSSQEHHLLKHLHNIKDAIGEWHDWTELVDIAARKLPHGKDCRLIRSLRIITAGKYSQAVLLANRMRRAILTPAALRTQILEGVGGKPPGTHTDAALIAEAAQSRRIFPVEREWLLR